LVLGMMACAWAAWSSVGRAQTSSSQPTTAVSETAVKSTSTAVMTEAEPNDPVEDFIQQVKHPVSWFSWGADVRIREEAFKNAITLNSENVKSQYSFQRYRERVWATITPVENLDINARLIYEPRHYSQPAVLEGWATDEAMFDILNVSYKKAFGLPLTVTVGRQEIILGDGWLVLEGTPEDGSRTISFDAVRTTWDLKPIATTVDAIYINQDARSDQYIENFCDAQQYVRTDNEQGTILYVRNQSIQNTKIDGYFMYKRDRIPDIDGWPGPRVSPIIPDNADLYTFGGRGEYQFDEHWNAHGEIAGQLGEKNDRAVSAMGATTLLTYSFKDKYQNKLHTGYEFLSGDESSDGTGRDHQFNLLWGRYPQWSELYVYTYAKETRIADVTNLQRFNVVGWSFKPCKPLEFQADYHLLWANENPKGETANFSENGLFRGQLLTAKLLYQFTSHISGHLWGEFFAPGNYYSDQMNDVALFLRAEIVFKW
jgi:hypothetical protein